MARRGAARAYACLHALLLAACGIGAVGSGESIDAGAVTGSSGSIPDGAPSDGPSTVDTGDGSSTALIDSTPACTEDTSTSLAHCGACNAACPAGSTSCVGGQCLATLRIRVGIDGESHFIWQGAQAHWHQVTYAAPARHVDTPLPLQLNGQTFNPTWPNADADTQNYSCKCDSSSMTVPSPPLPAKPQNVALEAIAYRVSISVLEQPSAANGHRLTVRFYDVGMGGSAYYEALLTYQTR